MEWMADFRQTAIAAAALGPTAGSVAGLARLRAPRVVVLVEGASDRAAVEALAGRRGRDLGAEGVCVLPIGGATGADRFIGLLGPRGLGLTLAGLCDEAEEAFFQRALERAGAGSGLGRTAREGLGFFVCSADLEDELIRSLGTAAVEDVLSGEGDLRSFRKFQRQPAQRGRRVEQQLRRFMGTTSGRKEHYGQVLGAALEPANTPQPLAGLLARL